MVESGGSPAGVILTNALKPLPPSFSFTSPETNERTMECNICQYRTTSINCWRAHKSRHRSKLLGTFKCPYCDFESRQAHQGLRDHINWVHNTDKETFKVGLNICLM